MSTDDPRLEALRRALTSVHATLSPGFVFRLWDGSNVPADAPADRLAVVVRHPGVAAEFVRRPSVETLIRAYATGHLDLANGTFFDLAEARPKGKLGRVLGRLDKGAILKAAVRFLAAPGLPDEMAETGTGEGRVRDGRPETNRRNIARHYDVSNDFYKLFLDARMAYSCAVFETPEQDLEAAQLAKLDLVCRKLALKPGERLLDIGCGWGGLAIHAAKTYGVSVTGVTLSAEQRDEALARIAAAGLSDRIEIRFQDYTTLTDKAVFDKAASIEMFEHVGLKNHDTYFATVHRLLKPGGLYLHQASTRIAKRKGFDRHGTEYKALVKHIFPGGEVDHVGLSVQHLEAHKFEIHEVTGLREHYRRTTRAWHDRLAARAAEAERLVGRETARIWLLYLAGCSLAFERGSIGVFQTLASKRTKPAKTPR